MPGLIDTELTGTKKNGDVLSASGVGYDPEKRSVAANELVSNNLDEILKTDSPLLQRARARAAGQSNARGLINSTMGAQAGEAAVIDAALPIASADAGTYNLAARENQQAGNTALQFGATATNQAAAQNVGEAGTSARQVKAAELETGLIGTRATAERGLIELRGEVETGLQTLRGNQAKTLAEIESNYKQLMQTNASSAALFNESMAQIATILRDPNTSAEQKASAVSGVNSLLESSLAVAGAISNLDLGSLLEFSDTSVAALAPPTSPAPPATPSPSEWVPPLPDI